METKRKILIIDDEPDILEFLSYNFRKKGFKVIIANNGFEGLQKARLEKPEIIISDILMPQMDGIEMCKSIRKDKELIDIPFIFLTAVNDDYKVLYAMTSGADQLASKPIRFEYLLNMVNNLLVEAKY
ncbi:MAG: DNA-binding response regulator MtrA [Bacteroidota bacterium]|jgi:two-component system alkaline phosphatase synthesis response regulator PhoP|nr:DNA-binding response regulator MtrA [Bacteroidota bacterium]